MIHKRFLPTIFTLICLFLSSESAQSQLSRRFEDYPDTLVLESYQEKGVSLFHAGAGFFNFRDTADLKKMAWFQSYPDKLIRYPDFIDSLKLGFVSVFLNPLKFYDPFTHEVKVQTNKNVVDQEILTVKGFVKGEEVFIIDQNDNQDLTDDAVRRFTPFEWYGTDKLIRCEFDIKVDGETLRKYGWLNLGLRDGDLLHFSSQHAVAEFSIGNKLFKIGVVDDNCSTFCYYKPQLAILAENGIQKDTLHKEDFVLKNEFIFLGKQPYRFHEFYSGSSTIILVKENEYEKKIGIQVGLLAPDFTIKTVAGQEIKRKDLSDKAIMIVNLTGCGGPETYEKYKAFAKKMGDVFHIIALEPKINKNLPGYLVDTEDSFNKDFYKKYRDAYSSYDCFHIGMDGRIKDVFNIFDWEKSMMK